MKFAIGCIGCGTMGGAIMAGLCKSLPPDRYSFCGCNRSQAKMEPLIRLGVEALPDARSTAARADLLIIAVKPGQARAVLEGIAPDLCAGKIVISIVAGLSLAAMALPPDVPAARCMPNTPARVGEGVFAFCFNRAGLSHKGGVFDIFGRLGLCLELGEDRITAFSALVGAGPAYVFGLMQALVQAGVTLGFGHVQSREMVVELFGGCAAMARAMPDRHLLAMRDEVCSPAGLTIAGVNSMDAAGLTGKMIEAVLAANARGAEMEA